jgi:hypothetical protein
LLLLLLVLVLLVLVLQLVCLETCNVCLEHTEIGSQRCQSLTLSSFVRVGRRQCGTDCLSARGGRGSTCVGSSGAGGSTIGRCWLRKWKICLLDLLLA